LGGCGAGCAPHTDAQDDKPPTAIRLGAGGHTPGKYTVAAGSYEAELLPLQLPEPSPHNSSWAGQLLSPVTA
jgi:hypothetical protein